MEWNEKKKENRMEWNTGRNTEWNSKRMYLLSQNEHQPIFSEKVLK